MRSGQARSSPNPRCSRRSASFATRSATIANSRRISRRSTAAATASSADRGHPSAPVALAHVRTSRTRTHRTHLRIRYARSSSRAPPTRSRRSASRSSLRCSAMTAANPSPRWNRTRRLGLRFRLAGRSSTFPRAGRRSARRGAERARDRIRVQQGRAVQPADDAAGRWHRSSQVPGISSRHRGRPTDQPTGVHRVPAADRRRHLGARREDARAHGAGADAVRRNVGALLARRTERSPTCRTSPADGMSTCDRPTATDRAIRVSSSGGVWPCWSIDSDTVYFSEAAGPWRERHGLSASAPTRARRDAMVLPAADGRRSSTSAGAARRRPRRTARRPRMVLGAGHTTQDPEAAKLTRDSRHVHRRSAQSPRIAISPIPISCSTSDCSLPRADSSCEG